jgi:uncharacterized membrane protein YeaQ/YmgE (transglycosylase-associated protein family)
MDAQTLIIWIIVGAIAGWLAGLIVRGFGFGPIGNIVVGILGAIVGSWLLVDVLHVSFGAGIINTILTAILGAVVLLLIVRVVKRA